MEELEPLPSSAGLADRTAQLLRERILDGRFQLGERVVETTLARQLKISRAPIREALRQLLAEGLVRDEPRHGMYVTSLSERDIREIYGLRAAIETRALRILLEKPSGAVYRELATYIQRMRKAAREHNPRALAKEDLGFHEAICRLSGNRRLHHVFVSQAGVLQALVALEHGRLASSLARVARQHDDLLAALKTEDVDRTVAACEAHLIDAVERLSSLVKTHA